MKSIKRDEEAYHIMIKGSIQQEEIMIINLYAPNVRAPTCVKQILMEFKGETLSNSSSSIVGAFNSQLTSIDRRHRNSARKHRVHPDNRTKGLN